MILRLLALLTLAAALTAASDGGIFIDPNGGTASIDEGCGLDPNGGCAASNLDKGLGADPNG